MIKIVRNRLDGNGVEIRPPDSWFKMAMQKTKLAINEKHKHVPDRGVYSHDHLRATLEELFHNKCAYCETPLPEVDWDTEHYRPKSAVAENKKHPGYYWLIYDWENLFPSCVPCNEIRKDKPIYGDLTYARTGGKFTQFPLEDESKRAFNNKDNIKDESPLLLNPCLDNPESYLSYDIQGKPIALKDNKRAIATISICHLDRRRINKRRLRIIKDLVEALELQEDFKKNGNNSEAKKFEKMIQNIFLDDSRFYAGAARAVVGDPTSFGL